MSDYIGRGWTFPPTVDSRGRIALSSGAAEIEEAIRLILLTSPGERLMRPEFGCRVHELAFAPNDATTAGLAAYYVEDALRRWEPRIRVLSVDARPDEQHAERLLIDIAYEVKATYDRRALVFPFYRIPAEERA